MHCSSQVFVWWILFNSLSWIRVFASFHFENENDISANIVKSSLISQSTETKFYKDWSIDSNETTARHRNKRSDDGTFYGHPKTREERWHAAFNMSGANLQMEQAQSLVTLLVKVMDKYLNSCIPIVLYDKCVESSEGIILETFFKSIKISYLHGKINDNFTVVNQNLLTANDKSCRSYIVFLSEVLKARDVLGPQVSNRVILIPRSTQWALQEFLSSKEASDIVNLLVIGESVTADPKKERPYVLYTHKLYTDGLGSSAPVMLTSWIRGKLSRPNVNLFPRKLTTGFRAHRFLVSAIHQPPYVSKTSNTDAVGNKILNWDGFEIRLLKLLSHKLNFTYQIIEPVHENVVGKTFGVIDMVEMKEADIGIAGAFISNERMLRTEMSVQHTADCAAFITLSSKALPRYRAIMGPFQWPVWLAIILTYLFAIFPLAFSDRLTLRHLVGNWGEIENMFWYVFGTFTNSLVFSGKFSWSNTKKTSTRLLIGTYWMFSIIITACYTGSIIAFVTLPVFPETIDSIEDLIDGFYRIGTLVNDGWPTWFTNSSDANVRKLAKNLELVSDVDEGLRNVTSAFFWGYAFVGSQAQLQFIAQNNLTDGNLGKKSSLHIAEQCLARYGVSLIFPHDTVYAQLFNDVMLRMHSSGLNLKIQNDLAWDLQRSDSKQLLDSTKSKKFSLSEVEERKLNLADTEGMFLLLALGYIVAGSILISEMVGGCAKSFRQFVRRKSNAIVSFHRNISRRSSIASIEDGSSPPPFASFTQNLRRRFSQQIRRKSTTEISLFLKKMFKRSENQFAKNVPSVNVSNDWSSECEPHRNVFPDYYDIDEENIDMGLEYGGEEKRKDSYASSTPGLSSIDSKSHVIREEHLADVNILAIENRDEMFGEPINCQQ